MTGVSHQFALCIAEMGEQNRSGTGTEQSLSFTAILSK